MADMRTSKEWREYELLAARIEKALRPLGAHVESPGRVRDKFTGQMREVDVAIRYPVGGVDLLITVECRRRSDVQDVTWIEELVGKRESVGAVRTIAVSAEGFTKPAVESAAQRGIEIRKLSEVSDQDIQGWLRFGGIKFRVVRPRLRGVTISQWDRPGQERDEVHPDVWAALKTRSAGAKVFAWRDSPDHADVSINVLLQQIMREPAWTAGVPQDGTPVSKEVHVDPQGQLLVRTTSGKMSDVAALELKFDLAMESYDLPVGERRFSSYEDADQMLAQHSKYSMRTPGGNALSMDVVRDMKTNQLRVTLPMRDLAAFGEELKNNPPRLGD